MKKIRRFSILVGIMLMLQLSVGILVYAADGKLSIAVSEETVAVGDTVKITLRGTGSNGESAVSDMVFSYDSAVFSFVSCNASGYSGGDGGQVNFSGTTVEVELKAIAEGDCYLKVSATNGRLEETGEALSNMTDAGVIIHAGAVLSGDNSLKNITMSAGELSPEFSGEVTEYTATVSYDIAELEVMAEPSHSGAVVESISCPDELQIGENIITITVVAENGQSIEYTIVVTREEQQAVVQIPEESAPQEITDDSVIEEYEATISFLQEQNTKIQKDYEEKLASARRTRIIMTAIIVILLIVCVVLLVMRKHDNNQEEFEEIKKEPKAPQKDGVEVIDFDEFS